MRRLLTATAFAALLTVSTAHAATQSTNYRQPSDAQGAGGGDYAKSTNYRLDDTIGEQGIGESDSANYTLGAGYRQTLQTFISITGPATVDLGTVTGTGQESGEGTWVVTTDSAAGYSLEWSASSANMTSGGNTIGPFTPPSANVPDSWTVAATDSEWGGRVRSSSTDTAAEWGTDSSSEKWLNVATSARTIITRTTRTDVSGSNEIVQFRAEIGASKIQLPGTYSVTITLTATAL